MQNPRQQKGFFFLVGQESLNGRHVVDDDRQSYELWNHWGLVDTVFWSFPPKVIPGDFYYHLREGN